MVRKIVKSKKIIAIIPARMGSSRFPGKPLANLAGVPMIGLIYRKVSKAKNLDHTFVATCDIEIFNYMKSIHGHVIMTFKNYQRSSDRCAEVLEKIVGLLRIKFDIVVMVQGDEPMVTGQMVDKAVQPMLKDKKIKVINLMGPIRTKKEFEDKNCIKVVCDKNMNALYFSRNPIPYPGKTESQFRGKQVCVIPFQGKFLKKYRKMTSTPLEKQESVDMLRILEHGYPVKMVKISSETYSVDTLQDLQRVQKYLGGSF